MNRRTYVDSCVWIAALKGDPDLAEKALSVLDDPDREILVSEYVRLETLPKPRFQGRADQVRELERMFACATSISGASADVIQHAVELAGMHDLTPCDALHISTAMANETTEFVTAEKPTKPLFRVPGIAVVSIHVAPSANR